MILEINSSFLGLKTKKYSLNNDNNNNDLKNIFNQAHARSVHIICL